MMVAVNKHLSLFASWLVGLAVIASSLPVAARAQMTMPAGTPSQTVTTIYLDPVNGKTVDELVALALENNGEIIALRKEAEAGEAMVNQAGLRANPSVAVNGTRQLGGTDNNVMIQGEQPLELGGRRPARIRVARQELEIRKQAVAERERQVAADVRSKFGEALAAATKLTFADNV
ncbi:MAG TPA: TolC family protein, partial [Pyrinomonadaceae bacterium]|nr:TolC family protein [Pyrinomonadaceae bacterium]